MVEVLGEVSVCVCGGLFDPGLGSKQGKSLKEPPRNAFITLL